MRGKFQTLTVARSVTNQIWICLEGLKLMIKKVSHA